MSAAKQAEWFRALRSFLPVVEDRGYETAVFDVAVHQQDGQTYLGLPYELPNQPDMVFYAFVPIQYGPRDTMLAMAMLLAGTSNFIVSCNKQEGFTLHVNYPFRYNLVLRETGDNLLDLVLRACMAGAITDFNHGELARHLAKE